MGVFTGFNASASGLTAERLRLDLIANNIANINTTRTPEGGPYRRQVAVLSSRQSPFAVMLAQIGAASPEQAAAGVVVSGIYGDPSPFPLRYDPHHPDAGPDGYVAMPNVDIVSEMVDLMTATRAYQADVTAFNTAKTMAQRAFEIGR